MPWIIVEIISVIFCVAIVILLLLDGFLPHAVLVSVGTPLHVYFIIVVWSYRFLFNIV